jgi:hypothetical protein
MFLRFAQLLGLLSAIEGSEGPKLILKNLADSLGMRSASFLCSASHPHASIARTSFLMASPLFLLLDYDHEDVVE